MGEAAIIAVSEVVKAVTELVKVVIASQTPDQQKIMWDWYIADVTAWRKLIGLDT